MVSFGRAEQPAVGPRTAAVRPARAPPAPATVAAPRLVLPRSVLAVARGWDRCLYPRVRRAACQRNVPTRGRALTRVVLRVQVPLAAAVLHVAPGVADFVRRSRRARPHALVVLGPGRNAERAGSAAVLFLLLVHARRLKPLGPYRRVPGKRFGVDLRRWRFHSPTSDRCVFPVSSTDVSVITPRVPFWAGQHHFLATRPAVPERR